MCREGGQTAGNMRREDGNLVKIYTREKDKQSRERPRYKQRNDIKLDLTGVACMVDL
jgi:hypothetical protein